MILQFNLSSSIALLLLQAPVLPSLAFIIRKTLFLSYHWYKLVDITHLNQKLVKGLKTGQVL